MPAIGQTRRVRGGWRVEWPIGAGGLAGQDRRREKEGTRQGHRDLVEMSAGGN